MAEMLRLNGRAYAEKPSDHPLATSIPEKRDQRIVWLQTSKGVGIILLVILHVCAESGPNLPLPSYGS